MSPDPKRGIPKTKALADQKELSLDPPAQWWLGVLRRGSLPLTAIADWENGPIVLDPMSKDELLTDYERFLRASRSSSGNASHKAIVEAGKALGLETGMSKGGKQRIWTLPPLRDAQRRFAERLGASGLFD